MKGTTRGIYHVCGKSTRLDHSKCAKMAEARNKQSMADPSQAVPYVLPEHSEACKRYGRK